jgi:hypothetical protein
MMSDAETRTVLIIKFIKTTRINCKNLRRPLGDIRNSLQEF